jgi:hypothetical protein
LYTGKNELILNLLNSVLGKQIAGG